MDLEFRNLLRQWEIDPDDILLQLELDNYIKRNLGDSFHTATDVREARILNDALNRIRGPSELVRSYENFDYDIENLRPGDLIPKGHPDLATQLALTLGDIAYKSHASFVFLYPPTAIEIIKNRTICLSCDSHIMECVCARHKFIYHM